VVSTAIYGRRRGLMPPWVVYPNKPDFFKETMSSKSNSSCIFQTEAPSDSAKVYPNQPDSPGNDAMPVQAGPIQAACFKRRHLGPWRKSDAYVIKSTIDPHNHPPLMCSATQGSVPEQNSFRHSLTNKSIFIRRRSKPLAANYCVVWRPACRRRRPRIIPKAPERPAGVPGGAVL
jgi:hypothetical protein